MDKQAIAGPSPFIKKPHKKPIAEAWIIFEYLETFSKRNSADGVGFDDDDFDY